MIFEQLAKLETKVSQMRKFWNLFEIEKRDIQMCREECLTERVALSALKSGAFKSKPEVENLLWKNQFASLKNQL